MDPESTELGSQPSDKVSGIQSQAIGPNNDPDAAASNPDTFAQASNNKPPARVSEDGDASTVSSNIPSSIASNNRSTTKASNSELASATERSRSARESPSSMLSGSKLSSWSTSFKFPKPVRPPQDNSPGAGAGMSPFARFTTELGLRLPSITPLAHDSAEGTSTPPKNGVFESFTKGLVDTSLNAVKAVQVKARHIVSQNKRRYQEGEFDLDMTYITENIIAMGFPAGDLSSGIFGYFEGFYRNHMEEVIKFFETHHKGKYKVYNLCSERLYDASLFEGKVACFPFDDHNCPPLQLIPSFCQSAYSWLKEDILNVVVVHCKAGMARTGLMICSLLLFLKFFRTAEEAIDYYNQKRCVDGKALVLPSQIRYVRYFERVLTYFDGEVQPGRRCMLRGFRLHRCPYWVRPSITISNHNGLLFSTKKHPKTKDLMPEDFWISAPKKGIVVFALPGEPGLTELVGDFKIHFHDRQGDFYCWLNTTMTENRKILDAADLDGFDKRKFPSPGFQVEVVMIDYNGTLPTKTKADSESTRAGGSSGRVSAPSNAGSAANSSRSKESKSEENDNVFSDSEGEESGDSKKGQPSIASEEESKAHKQVDIVSPGTGLGKDEPGMHTISGETTNGERKPTSSDEISHMESVGASNIKAMAADASVFSFGDEEDYESE